MDEAKTTEQPAIDEEQAVYLRNRKRFLKWSKTLISFLFIILVIAGAVFFMQSRKLAQEKALLQEAVDKTRQH